MKHVMQRNPRFEEFRDSTSQMSQNISENPLEDVAGVTLSEVKVVPRQMTLQRKEKLWFGLLSGAIH